MQSRDTQDVPGGIIYVVGDCHAKGVCGGQKRLHVKITVAVSISNKDLNLDDRTFPLFPSSGASLSLGYQLAGPEGEKGKGA